MPFEVAVLDEGLAPVRRGQAHRASAFEKLAANRPAILS
jgi:hypothetical protein